MQTLPVLDADQDDRKARYLAGLDQGQGLEELVQRAESAGQDDEGLGVLDEHGLAGEEIPEVDAEIDPVVQPLLERQLDSEADGEPPGLLAPLLTASIAPGPPPVITA